MKRNRLLCLVLIYANLLGFTANIASAQNDDLEKNEVKKGLEFRLREIAGKSSKTETSQLAPTSKLSDAESDAIIRRLPPMDTEISGKADFKLRPESLPPPKTGKTMAVKFPSDAQNITPPNIARKAENALEILRVAPLGAANSAADLSVTFSAPMIAVSSQTEAAQTVPVKLSPEAKGKWHWLGTRTLIFDAAPRLPMATRFSATIPAGTRSANGEVLAQDYSWTFETPAPLVESFSPDGKDVRRNQILLAKFNQYIKPEDVLPKITATAGGEKIALRMAASGEIVADKMLSEKIKTLVPNQWMAFRAIDLLPNDSQIFVNFESGISSAEGELTSAAAQNFTFRTFGKMRLAEKYCGYRYSSDRDNCAAYEDFHVAFSNSIDAESFDKSLVKIEPKIENPEISFENNEIRISGVKDTRTEYTVTISGKLKDVFEQTLGEKAAVKFETSAKDAQLSAEKSDDLITLDPFAQHFFSVYSTNYKSLDVKIYAVNPEDYAAFNAYLGGERITAPAVGKLVYDKTLPVKSKPDESRETKINLASAMPDGFGHALLVVNPTGFNLKDDRLAVWLQATNIGVDAFADYEKINIYASDLRNGKPLRNVNLKFLTGASGTTGENGLATIDSPKTDGENWLIAQNGTDSAILLGRDDYNGKKFSAEYKPETLRWFVFDDRKMYRPGETVSVKGYLRKIAGGKAADVEALADAASGLNYVLRDSVGREVLRGTADLNAFGGFDFQIKTPEEINLGYESLQLSTESNLENKTYTHQFQVQEFRRPEFEVTAKNETAAPFYVGNSATISVEAKYYAGGGLADAETNWKVTARPTDYAPPNREDFTFGKYVPWWTNDYESETSETTTENFKGKTDKDGRHFLALDFVKDGQARPFEITAEARVQDVNRQTFAGSTTLLVHPSELYVGLKTPKNFIGAGEKFTVETITTDIVGKSAADAPVSIVAELKDWQQIKGEWQNVTIDTQKCQIKSANDIAKCEFYAKGGGVFTISASVLDSKERRNESELNIWVAGGHIAPSREIEKETVELIPNKKEYVPNETAEILVNAPFFPAEGVLTLRRNGVVKTERFTMNEPSTVLRIPIEERFLPNIYASVDLFGAQKRIVFDDKTDDKLPKRPAFASGEINLDVSTASRNLKVAAEPLETTLEPGGATSINIAVADNDGKPSANTEVAVVAVDESILALTNYKIQNPLDEFYQPLEAETNDYYSRENILLGNVEDLVANGKSIDLKRSESGIGYGNGNGDGSGDGGGGGRQPDTVFRRLEIITSLNRPPSKNPDEIRLRQNFNALAIFSPSVLTNADGKATVKINLPDNLTRYRITAIAVTDSKKFGKTEAAITARQKLMIRPSAPRFMNFGDTAELPVVLQNQTDQPLTVEVAIRATNANLADGNGRRLTIAANDRAEIRFPVSAESAGTARFQVGAVSGSLADAAEFSFPVLTPATTEAFATYGTTDESGAIVQPISAPNDVFPQFGGLEVTTSSTQLQELTDAFIYLQSYPYECSEQISSRILSVAALRDVLQAFDAKDMPTKAQIEAKMTSDIARLQKLQHSDGGFSFWSGTDESLPFLTVHIAHALARAKSKGYDVPDAMSQKLLNYLRNIESEYRQFYRTETRSAISAYALYARNLLSDKDAAKAKKLLTEAGLENLSPESLAWILSVLADDKNSIQEVELIKRNLLNRVTETAGAANFVTNYTDGEYVLLASDRRTDGVILEALLKVQSSKFKAQSAELEDLIPKLVRGLLAHKTQGRWRNTQENAFILLALDKYFQTYEKITPNFVAKVWLGQNYAGEEKFAGRSVDSQLINIPMAFLQQNKTQNLILDKQGDGRLYYRIGLKYAPKNLKSDAADYGFAVSRTYEAIDDAGDVKQNTDRSWTFKSGARIRVRLQMIAPSRRYHVALVDNLPAGLEIVNANLAVSESLPEDAKIPKVSNGYRNYYELNWFDHENLRDNRVEVFKDLLYEGVWDYSFVTRATTPGSFTAPPAKAEEMYSPETFGRSKTDFIKVE